MQLNDCRCPFFQGLTQIRPRALIRKDFVPGSSIYNYMKTKLFPFLLGISRPHFDKLLDFSLGSLVKYSQAALPKLLPLVQIWSLLGWKSQAADGLNAKLAASKQ